MTGKAVVLRVEDERVTGLRLYVVECDVDAREGRGMAVFGDLDSAKRFPDIAAALDYWKRPSTVCQLRDDGQPNRPLTAFTVGVETVRDG